MTNKANPIPLRPITPYISLDDPHTKNFFTKSHIQNHLRRAGLLNKQGDILTQAEYESKQTDVAIGRENQRKIDDVILEVLNDLNKEHWAYARKYTESIGNVLRNQFQRITEKYPRRTQPISIQYTSDGRVRLQSSESRRNNHSDGTQMTTTQSIEPLRPIIPVNNSSRSQSSHSSTIRRSTEPDDIRQELNTIKDTLANLNKKLNTDSKSNDGLRGVEQLLDNLKGKQNVIQEQQRILNEKHKEEKQRIDELQRQFKPPDEKTQFSEIDKQQIQHFIQVSTVVKELHDRILILETSFHKLPTALSQEPIDQTTKISEKQTTDRERLIENLAHDTDVKIKQIQTQISTRLDRLPISLTHTEINQLIQNEIQNLQKTQLDNSQWQNLAREAMDKVNYLENELNKFIQSTRDSSTRSATEQLVTGTKLKKVPVSSTSPNFEQPRNDGERHLNGVQPSPDLTVIEKRLTQLENELRNMNDRLMEELQNQIKDNSEHLHSLEVQIVNLNERKVDPKESPRRVDDIEKRSEQLENLFNKIIARLEIKPDYEMIKRLIQESELTYPQINTLRQFIKEKQRDVKNTENNSGHGSNQQSSATSNLEDRSESNKDPKATDKPTSKELQAIMPFIEFLPNFDMFYKNENEWS